MVADREANLYELFALAARPVHPICWCGCNTIAAWCKVPADFTPT
jgi:hypothetical protein